MVNKMDEKIYFPKSFNEQMSWIDESIEHIIKHGKIKKDIQERGRASYGKQGYTHAIHRLFCFCRPGYFSGCCTGRFPPCPWHL